MSEATGKDAKTIHRLLEFDPVTVSFVRDERNPIDADLVVVDETSMVDLPLMGNLLRALRESTRLILVGDSDQLPPVGPGAVLREVIDSAAVPVVKLTHVYRQALNSLIVLNAHRVNHGELPLPESDGSDTDFFWIRREDPEDARDTLLTMVKERIPERLGVDPITDIQVLSPMHKGLLGTMTLNHDLQELLNPAQVGLKKGDRWFRQGDRVMQIKNNYSKMVFNGEQGVVQAVDLENCALHVAFPDRMVLYEKESLDELTLAYASTIHKAQGSEYPVVVIVLHTQHYIMLRRNLLYTGITRGEKMVVVIGNHRALNIAIRSDRRDNRYSRLGGRLGGSDSITATRIVDT